MKAIKKAIEICGSQQNLARICKVKQPAVSQWLNGKGISARYIPLIVEATNGAVTYQEICDEQAELASQKKS